MSHSKSIAIIGTGKVAGALGPRLAAAGYVVTYGMRTPEDPRIAALVARTGTHAKATTPKDSAASHDVILFTPPWLAAEATVKSLGDLRGKVLIDTTNAFTFRDGRDVALPVVGSAAEMIQSWAPGVRVVKAFNTVNFRVMADPAKGEGPTTIPLAGDDAAAKIAVAEIVRALPPFVPFDVGALSHAGTLEQMAMLYVSVILQPRDDAFEYVLRPRKK